MERYLPTNSIRYIAIGDGVDTLNPDGLQFLTFKLSFNDYYAQDISNKIKSVKKRKTEKGEFQGNTPPYGYMKDNKQKNHLVPDLETSGIVVEIFDMYVNKGMSTSQIAKELNERGITAPGIYLKIPKYTKNKTLSDYKWHGPYIGKMLKNEVYIGSVVGKKYEKISHKVDKVRLTKKEEHVIVKNMHEPIIDELTFRKAVDKLNKYTHVRIVRNEQPLKEFIYCLECGGKATYRVRNDKRKSGKIWEQKTFICSNKNNRKKNCNCKPIKEDIIIDKVRQAITDEIQEIKYSENELLEIYKKAEEKVNSKINHLKGKVKKLKAKLYNNETAMQEVYNDKIQKIISIDDFNIFYKKLQKEKNEVLDEIHKMETEILEIEKGNTIVDYKEIINLAKKLLAIDNPTRELYAKLIEKIEFDSKQNVRVTLTFGKLQNTSTLMEVG